VLSSFREIGTAVEELLDPQGMAAFQERAAGQVNRAVFEIPDFMEKAMRSRLQSVKD
jgi:hypothetical protein